MDRRALAWAKSSALRAALGAPLSLLPGGAAAAEVPQEGEGEPSAQASQTHEMPAEAAAIGAPDGALVPSEPEEVTVRGKRPEPSRSATFTRNEVRELPGAFGDPFRAIEALPGVTPIVSGLPFYFVRSAPPGNVGYFLDGIRVPLLFHVGGGPSVIHPGLVDPPRLWQGEDCVLDVAQNGNDLSGLFCGREVGVDLGGPQN